jgi:polyisoprenoid-binding protein YceI
MPGKVVPMRGKVKKALVRAPLVLGLLWLAACARQVGQDASPAALPAPPAAPGIDATRPTPAGVQRYRIDAARSLLTIRVFRGGALAAAGHDHVIASRDLEGLVDRAPELERSRVTLRIPVARLSIDDPALRAAAGPEFAAEVPEAAREGTRRNLLGPALLDGERFPWIELDSTRVVAAPGGASLTLRARVRGADSSFAVPVTLEAHGGELVASGEVELRQSQLGLTPFSVMMGALQVQDAMRVRFRLVAVR